jgi:hypothetical protein
LLKSSGRFHHCLPRNDSYLSNTHTLPRREPPFPLHSAQPAVRPREPPHLYLSPREEVIAGNSILQPCQRQVPPNPDLNLDDQSQMNTQWTRTPPEGIDHSQQRSSLGPGDRSQAKQRPDSKPTAVRSSIACIACRSKKQKVRTFLSNAPWGFPPLNIACALGPFSVLFGLLLVRVGTFG